MAPLRVLFWLQEQMELQRWRPLEETEQDVPVLFSCLETPYGRFVGGSREFPKNTVLISTGNFNASSKFI